MTPHPYSQSRRGMALIFALAVLAAVTGLVAAVGMQIVSQRAALERRQHQLQAQWLARAGVELGAARLLEKAEEFKEERTDLIEGGKVRVAVEKAGPDLYTVTAEAETTLPSGPQVVHSASARYRRTGRDGAARLEPVAP
jgi:hypothetical protein